MGVINKISGNDPYGDANIVANVVEYANYAIENRDENQEDAERELGAVNLTLDDAENFHIGFVGGKLVIPDNDKYMTGISSDFVDKEGKSTEGYSLSIGATNSIMYKHLIADTEARVVFIVEGTMSMLAVNFLEYAVLSISTKDVDALLKEFDRHPKNTYKDRLFIIHLDNDAEGKKACRQLLNGLVLRNINAVESIHSQEGERSYYQMLLEEGGDYTDQELGRAIDIADQRIDKFNEIRKEYISNKLEDIMDEFHNNCGGIQLEKLLDSIDNDEQIKPVSTSHKLLDTVLGGGLFNELYILGALPGLGKTTFVLQIADYIASRGRAVLFFSLEMQQRVLLCKSLSRISFTNLSPTDKSWEALTDREISLYKRVIANEEGISYRDFNEAEVDLFGKTIGEYEQLAGNIQIINPMESENGICSLSALQIKDYVSRYIKLSNKKPVVIIDYIQRLAPIEKPDASDKSNMDMSSYVLREMCSELEIPVFAISSLNRAGYFGNKGASIFKESGALEYTGDVLMSMGIVNENEDTTAHDVESELRKNPRQLGIRVLKNRHGETGDVITFDFNPRYSYFVETGKKTWLSAQSSVRKKRTNTRSSSKSKPRQKGK